VQPFLVRSRQCEVRSLILCEVIVREFLDGYSLAIESAQKTLILNPLSVKVETNLALGYLLSDQYDKAEVIYRKWKGKKFEAGDAENADAIFLNDIAELESFGIRHADFQKVKEMFLE
jgi:hypothetical protein